MVCFISIYPSLKICLSGLNFRFFFFLFVVIFTSEIYASGGSESCLDPNFAGFEDKGYPAGMLLKKFGYNIQINKKEDETESPALKEVRELEELLFPAPSVTRKIRAIIDVFSGIFSSLKGTTQEEFTADELAWISKLAKPDIPLRWHPKILKFLKKFKEDPKWHSIIVRWFERREIYGFFIRKQLDCRGMPSDVQYVAMIESGYDPYAVSSAGAVGIWQFMPHTAKIYGLQQSSWIDARKNPELSTIAAIEYLRDLKTKLGSWELAFASYNAGLLKIMDAIQKFNTNDYWKLIEIEGALPWETTNYVPKILAVAIAGRNPEEFGIDGIKFLPQIDYNVAQIPIPVELSVIANTAGVLLEDLRKLNPELKKNRVPPDALPYPIRLPSYVSIASFNSSFEKVRENFKPLKMYKVKFGDTLERIARKTGSSTKEIREINEFDKNEKILPGTWILVRESGKKGKEQEKEEKKVVVVPHNKFNNEGKTRIFYEVVSGDTLVEIARFFKVNLSDILTWNAIDPLGTLIPGMVIQLFVDKSFDFDSAVLMREDEVQIMVAGSKEHQEYLQKKEGKKKVVYKAGRGETVVEISKKFDVKLDLICLLNDVSMDRVFQGGEEIILYVKPSVYKKYFSAGKGKKKEGGLEEGIEDEEGESKVEEKGNNDDKLIDSKEVQEGKTLDEEKNIPEPDKSLESEGVSIEVINETEDDSKASNLDASSSSK